MRIKDIINEEINTDTLNPKFYHEQQIGDYLYTAKHETYDGTPYLIVNAFDGDKKIGRADFYIWKDSMSSGMTTVHPDYQKKGVASTMYAYARMLGNTIEPSKAQLPGGKKMWKSWKKSGDAEHLA